MHVKFQSEKFQFTFETWELKKKFLYTWSLKQGQFLRLSNEFLKWAQFTDSLENIYFGKLAFYITDAKNGASVEPLSLH